MILSNDDVILLLKSLGNNLLLGRNVENSIYISLKNLQNKDFHKDKIIKLMNLGTGYKEIFRELALLTKDDSISRVWTLLSKTSIISSHETGEKIIEIAENLEINKKLTEKRDTLIKSQRYKILFLGSATSIFLGIIAGLAPLFATFISIFRNMEISQTALNIVPFSLYIISAFSIYFLSDIGYGKFNYKTFLFSTIVYVLSYFIAKGILILLLK
ncbi:MAG: hypothetical protein HZR80_01995 [Candidatus Heimdallarchaeota archaeon]